MKHLVLTFLLPLLGLVGCSRPGGGGAGAPASAGHQDGGGVILCFEKKAAIWVSIRATPEARANGWKERLQAPVLVVYGARGFNPAFTAGGHFRVAWVDEDRIVKMDEAGDGKYISPSQEITAALLIPDGAETGLGAGDRIMVVEGRS